MASISLPPPRSTVLPQSFNPADHSFSARSHRRSRMSGPLPIPPFAFPARNPGDTSSQNLPVEPQPRTPPPLPAFSFNPGEGRAPQPSTCAPQGWGGGHRRQYSEFVGVDRLVSPEAADDAHLNDEKPTPVFAKFPPPSPTFGKGGHGRRGHAHRRSGAVASMDLSAISRSLDTRLSAESAPSTPADPRREYGHDDVARRMSYSAPSLNRPESPVSPIVPAASSSLTHAEPTLDNGSSLASRQASTPTTTEVLESISDQAGESAGVRNRSAARNPEFTPVSRLRARPRTADAQLTFDRSETSIPDNVKPRKRPISSAGHSRAHKSMSSGVLDLALRKLKPGDDFHLPDFRRSSDAGSSDASGDEADDSCEPSTTAKGKAHPKKKKKKQKKVRSWGAILTRSKGKQGKRDVPGSDPSKPPPIITRTNSDLGSGLDVDFDDDNVVILRTPTNPNAPGPSECSETPTMPTLENSWKPRSFYEQGQLDDMQSPIIDLDAALGPFNTPEMRPGFVAGSHFSAATRHMYSGGRRGEFVGPEMRYHRRAESAPEMPPFDLGFMSGNRLAANSAMENADVFYEEEEDAFLAASGQSPKDEAQPASPLSGAAHVDSNDDGSAKSTNSSDTLTRHTAGCDKEPQNTGLGIRRNSSTELSSNPTSPSQEDHRTIQARSAVEQVQHAKSPLNRPKTPVDMIKQEIWQSRARPPSSPEVSPGFLPVDKRPATSPIELGPNISYLSLQDGRSLPDSSFPSPDFHSASDVPRPIATPSTGDRKFSRPSFHFPMDQPRASVEDVPSLTSSASTVTARMGRLSATFLPHPRLSMDRSASFSAGVARRSPQTNTAKRSSFASLSKLVVGPHGERSKLYHEEKPPGDAPDEAKKKGLRISRLMHFWRTKDKHKSNENTPPG